MFETNYDREVRIEKFKNTVEKDDMDNLDQEIIKAVNDKTKKSSRKRKIEDRGRC